MKITHDGLKDAFVLEVDLGEVPVWEGDYGETQLYPDTATGVKQAKFRVPEKGSEEWCSFIYALHTARGVRTRCSVVLRVAGREYSLSYHSGLPRAQMTDDGYVTFPYGHEPTLQELTDGVTATLQVRIPQTKTAPIGGSEAGFQGKVEDNLKAKHYATREYPAILPGTKVFGFCNKGQKKVSTGNTIIVTAQDGTKLFEKHIQQNGHRRGACEWEYGTIYDAAAFVTLMVIPHQSRGPWGGYFVFPALERTFSLPLEGIVFRQEDEDEFNH